MNIARFSFPRDIATVLSSVFVCWEALEDYDRLSVLKTRIRRALTRSPPSRLARIIIADHYNFGAALRVNQDSRLDIEAAVRLIFFGLCSRSLYVQ